MVAHVVMLRLRASLAPSDRESLLDAMRSAFTGIAEIRRVHIGKRITLGRGYETQMAEHYEYAAILEFDSEGDLRTYLDHPRHQDLGTRFFASAEAALVYDFILVDPSKGRDFLVANDR